MTEEMLHRELPFRPGFAALVVTEAHAIAGRRRRVRLAAGAVSAALLIGAVAFGTQQMWLRDTPQSVRLPQMIASIDPMANPFDLPRQTTVMDVMFPHAAAVAEFYDQYGADDADSLEDDAVFFPEAEGVAANES
ncbi:MAG TPA: hypothetical protein VMF58_02280 [Rhizomicrobium sp.]|nr:hypothetical protein [Rhizomicrobium sp.]